MAIVDQAAVGPDDVVLEVGAAGGLLTRPMLERACPVHAFEIDRRSLPRLEELAAADPRLALHTGDALKADLTKLDSPPTAAIANLAYNIAIPLIMTTIAGLPSVRRWAVMVQRELGERLFATPSTKAYAAVTHLVRLAFGQRFKTLANSLGGAAHAGATLSRDDVRAALRGLALGDAARPEQLSPPQWRAFAAALAGLGPA